MPFVGYGFLCNLEVVTIAKIEGPHSDVIRGREVAIEGGDGGDALWRWCQCGAATGDEIDGKSMTSMTPFEDRHTYDAGIFSFLFFCSPTNIQYESSCEPWEDTRGFCTFDFGVQRKNVLYRCTKKKPPHTRGHLEQAFGAFQLYESLFSPTTYSWMHPHPP